MTDRYVRSTDGGSGDSGLTWALAKDTLSNVAAGDAAGDRIFLSQAHAEASPTAQTITLAGTISTDRILDLKGLFSSRFGFLKMFSQEQRSPDGLNMPGTHRDEKAEHNIEDR